MVARTQASASASAFPSWLPGGLARTLGLLGLGMLIWGGISTALLQGRGDGFLSLRPLQDRTLGGGALLVAVLVLRLYLRPFAERQRWRQRALGALLAALLADLVLLALLHLGARSPGAIALAGAVVCIAALASVCLATLALEAPRSQWRLPAQLALALAGGAALFFAWMAWLWPGEMGGTAGASLLLLAAIAAALLLASWLGGEGWAGQRPRLRAATLGLLLVGPLLLTFCLLWWPAGQRPAWWLAVLAVAVAALLDARDHPRMEGTDG